LFIDAPINEENNNQRKLSEVTSLTDIIKNKNLKGKNISIIIDRNGRRYTQLVEVNTNILLDLNINPKDETIIHTVKMINNSNEIKEMVENGMLRNMPKLFEGTPRNRWKERMFAEEF
jgi:hypothetical protein